MRADRLTCACLSVCRTSSKSGPISFTRWRLWHCRRRTETTSSELGSLSFVCRVIVRAGVFRSIGPMKKETNGIMLMGEKGTARSYVSCDRAGTSSRRPGMRSCERPSVDARSVTRPTRNDLLVSPFVQLAEP